MQARAKRERDSAKHQAQGAAINRHERLRMQARQGAATNRKTEVLASPDYFFFFLGGPIGCLCGLPGFGGGIGTFGALTGGLIGFFGGGIGVSAGSIGCGGALYFFDIESFSILDKSWGRELTSNLPPDTEWSDNGVVDRHMNCRLALIRCRAARPARSNRKVLFLLPSCAARFADQGSGF